jgi:hypothetical protein
MKCSISRSVLLDTPRRYNVGCWALDVRCSMFPHREDLLPSPARFWFAGHYPVQTKTNL